MIRILLAGPTGLTGDALRVAFGRQEDMFVTGRARSVEQLDLLLPHCDVLLLTPQFQEDDIHALIQRVRTRCPEVKTLVLSTEDDPDTLLAYLEAGAAGYLLAREQVPDVMRKIRAAHRDRALVSPTVAAEMMSRLAELAQTPSHLREAQLKVENVALLTPREREVLALVAEAYINRQIAERLTIAPGTVKNHVHRILRKLEAQDREEAAEIYRLHHRQLAAVPA